MGAPLSNIATIAQAKKPSRWTPTSLPITLSNAKRQKSYLSSNQNSFTTATYTIENNIEITGKILDALFASLRAKNVNLKGCVLKVNMVLAGKKQAQQSTAKEVGQATAQVLRAHVPHELAGVVFLSGGQSVEQATENLQAVTNCGPFPWPVTFSYARALQDPALHAWQGNNENADAAREAFRQRLIANANALIKRQ